MSTKNIAVDSVNSALEKLGLDLFDDDAIEVMADSVFHRMKLSGKSELDEFETIEILKDFVKIHNRDPLPPRGAVNRCQFHNN